MTPFGSGPGTPPGGAVCHPDACGATVKHPRPCGLAHRYGEHAGPGKAVKGKARTHGQPDRVPENWCSGNVRVTRPPHHTLQATAALPSTAPALNRARWFLRHAGTISRWRPASYANGINYLPKPRWSVMCIGITGRVPQQRTPGVLVLETRASGCAVQRAVGGVRSSTPAVVGERGRHGEDLCAAGVVLPRMLGRCHGWSGRTRRTCCLEGTLHLLSVGTRYGNPPDVFEGRRAPPAPRRKPAHLRSTALSAAGLHHLNGVPAFVCPRTKRESRVLLQRVPGSDSP